MLRLLWHKNLLFTFSILETYIEDFEIMEDAFFFQLLFYFILFYFWYKNNPFWNNLHCQEEFFNKWYIIVYFCSLIVVNHGKRVIVRIKEAVIIIYHMYVWRRVKVLHRNRDLENMWWVSGNGRQKKHSFILENYHKRVQIANSIYFWRMVTTVHSTTNDDILEISDHHFLSNFAGSGPSLFSSEDSGRARTAFLGFF